jgi:hypothetical protein
MSVAQSGTCRELASAESCNGSNALNGGDGRIAKANGGDEGFAAEAKPVVVGAAEGPAPPFTIRHQEALDLELSLLHATLKRNYSSHRKTQYFRRLTMALHCVMKRFELNTLWSDVVAILARDLPRAEQEIEQQRKREEQTKKRSDIFWELKITKEADGRQRNCTLPEIAAIKDMFTSMQHRLEDISSRSVDGITQALSRLEYAASACLTEVARGFFLALVTVAVASVARIRSLLLRLQHHIAWQVQLTCATAKTSAGDGKCVYHDSRKAVFAKLEALATMLAAVHKDTVTLAATDDLAPETSLLSKAECAPEIREMGGTTDQFGASGMNGVLSPADLNEPLTAPPSMVSDQNDTGETVTDIFALAENRETTASSFYVDDAGVDHNAAILKLAKGRRTKKPGQEKRMVVETVTNEATRSSKSQALNEKRTPSSKPPKKKRKKSAHGKDFFDELFG